MSTGAMTLTRRGSRKQRGSQKCVVSRSANEASLPETADDSRQPRKVDHRKPDETAEQPCYCCIVAAFRHSWSSSGYPALKRIECRFESGILFIRGTVNSFYHKQMAQELVRRVDGVKQIVNELEVSSLCSTSKNEHDKRED